MFTKTFCKPGSNVVVVPVGMTVTLQYNAAGLLEKLLYGYGENYRHDISDKALAALKKTKLVPQNIKLKGGTTWVEGVFYTSKDYFVDGALPEALLDSHIQELIECPSSFTFYAFNVSSYASEFVGYIAIAQWLKLNGFNTLPQYTAPASSNTKIWETMINNDKFLFKYPLIAGLCIFDNNGSRYLRQPVSQFVVKSANKFVDENGLIKMSVVGDRITSTVDYSVAVKFNIHDGCLVCVSDSVNNPVYSVAKPRNRKQLTRDVVCDICGAPTLIPVSGTCTCSDPHCISKQYPSIKKMLNVLGMTNTPGIDEFNFDEFKKLVKAKKLKASIDILKLEPYKSTKIGISVDKLMEALVPIDVCVDTNVFKMFANTCGNSITTFQYYLENPVRMVNFNQTSLFAKRLVDWLRDDYNVALIKSFIELPNVEVMVQTKKFEGAPIFRGKTIALTGTFMHGSLSEVASIIRSYDATVITEENKMFDCLVTGDVKENVSGSMIADARFENLPIMTESEFFARYEIDADMAANLL